jgi:heme-degrading monooxygenase HmoA
VGHFSLLQFLVFVRSSGINAVITPPPDSIAVIFISGRSSADAEGYEEAALAMADAAAARDGYLGIDSSRDEQGLGITVSWWSSQVAAQAWRDDPDHTRIREQGRAIWYDWYRVVVATVERAYGWTRPEN